MEDVPSIAEPLAGDERNMALRNSNACEQMADLCRELLELAPDLSPREFLRSLGALVAGIDLGLEGYLQLARGGANGLIGGGFRAEYDDGTAGQARHFAGTAAAAAMVGEHPAGLLAHTVVDPAESIDGHLSTAALQFAHQLLDGELPLEQAGEWIRENVCDPEFAPSGNFTSFDVFTERVAAAYALRDRFADAEWRQLVDLPELIAGAAALAEQSGGLDDVREVVAAMRVLDQAQADGNELVVAIMAERYSEGFDWGDRLATPDAYAQRALAQVPVNLGLLQARGVVVEDATAYADLLMTVARAAVKASSSGGVLGFGKKEISQSEAGFLAQLELAIEQSAPGCTGCQW